MKKLLLILLLVLVLCACGKTEVPPEVLPESENSSSEEEPYEWHPLVYDRVDKHIFEYEFRHNFWAEELSERGISVSIENREFTGKEEWKAELVFKNSKTELSVPFGGIFDFNGNIYYGKVLFPDEKTAVFCGNKKALFFSTETLEVWDFVPEIPDFGKEDIWINGAGTNEKTGEILLFATPMDHFQTGEVETKALVFDKKGKFLGQSETKLRGTAKSGEKNIPFFFTKSAYFEYCGEAFLNLGYEIINLENKTVWKESDDRITAENEEHLLEISFVSPKQTEEGKSGYLAVLYKNGKAVNSMIFPEPKFCDPNYAGSDEKEFPKLTVKGETAVFRFDYFAMTLTLDFEKHSHKLEFNPTDANIDEYSEPIESSNGLYSICFFGRYGAGDISYRHVSLRDNISGTHRYIGEIGGMYGGYNGIGFLKNNDIYIYDNYSLKILDVFTLKVKFDINKNFPLGHDEETNSGRGILTFRRDPNDFSYIIVYYEYENGLQWDENDNIKNSNYKIGFLDSEGKLLESYDTGYPLMGDPFGLCNVDMRYSEDELTLIVTGNRGTVCLEGVFNMETKEFKVI
ncbi:MAG: hypothetical protein IJO22_02625 [Oscillospiraceae bacterium]|nr:hypothetical protein [Oscillospiraceae bacterium]